MSNLVFEAVIFDLNGVLIQNDWPNPDKSMLELVEKLKSNNIKTAVLSNLGSAAAASVREQQWTKVFDQLGFSGEIGYSKPDPRAFEVVAGMLKIEPTRCLFVDDEEYRLTGAREIGMSVHHFIDQRSLEDELHLLGVTD